MTFFEICSDVFKWCWKQLKFGLWVWNWESLIFLCTLQYYSAVCFWWSFDITCWALIFSLCSLQICVGVGVFILATAACTHASAAKSSRSSPSCSSWRFWYWTRRLFRFQQHFLVVCWQGFRLIRLICGSTKEAGWCPWQGDKQGLQQDLQDHSVVWKRPGRRTLDISGRQTCRWSEVCTCWSRFWAIASPEACTWWSRFWAIASSIASPFSLYGSTTEEDQGQSASRRLVSECGIPS